MIVLWDVDSGKRLPQSADLVQPVVQLRFTEGGQRLVGATRDFISWDPATGREIDPPSGAVAPARRSGFTLPDAAA